jgi:Flp pilus assembly protein TadG
MRLHKQPCPATAMVEFAVVAPVTFLLLLSLLIGGLGIFYYQQVAHLARDASRWASVHGTEYAKDTGKPPATAEDVYNQVIVPHAKGLNPSRLTYSVTWHTSNSPHHTVIVNGRPVEKANTVTVTVNFQWIPQAYLGGITLSSTSVTVMSY